MESLCKLIQNVKETNTGWDRLFDQLQPLVRGYAKKLFFLEQEDALQEINLAIFLTVRTMKHYDSDRECLKYIATGVYYTYATLCKKHLNNIQTVSFEENYLPFENSVNDGLADTEFFLEISNQLTTISPRKKEIMTYLLQGYKDSEIAEKLKVSRQYIYKVKQELFRPKN